MYLQSIEINGFKSFAEKTLLEFLPPKDGRHSITVVIGPNGSGKSNVADAIRWAMGEQSLKQLRGKKSEDIIFSGSVGKGQMSMASVLMTLDNKDHRADIEYDDLVIGRRLYRSGDSEYILNESPVRLLDLQLLLAKAQFGQGSYAVIGQGMIDKLLLQSTEERKDFFDEAAGIKEFQIKRHQATLRLARTKEHIEQADVLLNEITPRLKSLSRQVKKLEQRKEVEVELREKQDQYYASLWHHHQSAIDAVQVELRRIDSELQQAQNGLQTTQEELATLARGASRQEAFRELQEKYQELVSKKNGLERERAVLGGRLQTEYSKSGQHQIGWLESKIEKLREQQAELGTTIVELERKQKDGGAAVGAMRQEIEELSLERTALRGEIATLESGLVRLRSELTTFHVTGFQAVQAVLEAREDIGGVEGVVAQLGDVEKRYQVALDVAAGGRLASLVVDDVDAAKRAVEYLRQGRFGVATFLPLTKIRSSDVPAYVRDLAREKGVCGLAYDLVRFESRFADVFSYVFGNTLVVEDFATAERIGIGRARMVTLEGDLFETTGAVKGGHRKVKENGLSFANTDLAYAVARDSEECEQKITAKHQTLTEVEETLIGKEEQRREREAEMHVVENKTELLLSQKHAVDEELAGLEQELARETMSPEQFGAVMQDIASQKNSAEGQIASLETELKQVEKEMEQFNDEEEKKKQRIFALQDAMQKQQEVVNALVTQRNEQQVTRAKLETKQEDLQHELFQELRVSIESIVERGIEPLPTQQLEHVLAEIQKLKYTLTLIGGIDEEVLHEYGETKERHDQLSGQLTDLKKAMEDLEELVEELDTVMKKKRDRAFKEIRKGFQRFFVMLFEGGEADLSEVYEEEKTEEEKAEQLSGEGEESAVDVEEAEETKIPKRKKKILAGIDITACPPGKKIKNIQALSGGERTLTSIALMCAILKTNPSPFVVLDEVEAALDESNTLKVVNIIKELATQSQFIIITHNRVTMHAADALYGVTMGGDGVSKLLSVQLDKQDGV